MIWVWGKEDKLTSALTLTKSITPKTCATIATIEKGKQKWHIYASTKTNLIIQVDYVRTAILLSITSRENKNFQSRNFRITKVKTILKN